MGNLQSFAVRIVNETQYPVGLWKEEVEHSVDDEDKYPGPLETKIFVDTSQPYRKGVFNYGYDSMYHLGPKQDVRMVARKQDGKTWPSPPFNDAMMVYLPDAPGSFELYMAGEKDDGPIPSLVPTTFNSTTSNLLDVTAEQMKDDWDVFDRYEVTIRMKPQFHGLEMRAVCLPSTLHPVLDVEGYCSNFVTTDFDLWTPGTDGSAAIPCTIDLATSSSQSITVTFLLRPELRACSFVLTGRIRGEETDLLKTDAPIVVPASGLVEANAKFQAVNGSQCVPWVAKGELIWKLRITNGTGPDVEVLLGTHMLELYAVSARLPPYFSHAGIPQEFLQCMVPPRGGGLATFKDYIKHVIYVIRDRCGMIYDTFHGAPDYAHIDRVTRTASFSLRKWLLNTRLHRESGNKLDFLVNCYDLGSAVQVGLMLGILDEATEDLLQWHYLAPFGYINPTSLIGWEGNCNSPFFRANLDKKCFPNPNNTERTGFLNHVFLSYENKVLDATCGPQIGEWTISEYIEKAIDRETTLYAAKSKDWEDKPPMGTVNRVRSGKGTNMLGGYTGSTFSEGAKAEIAAFVQAYDVHASTGREVGAEPKHFGNISFDGLTTELNKRPSLIKDYDLEAHDQGHNLIDPDKAHLAWTIIVVDSETKTQYPVSLSIDVCRSTELALATWGDYLGMASVALEDAFVFVQDGARLGIRHITTRVDKGPGFQLWVTGKLCIKLQGASNDILSNLAALVQNFLDTSAATAERQDAQGTVAFGKGVTVLPSSSSPSGSLPNHYPLHTSFVQNIKVPKAFQFRVAYDTGCTFLLKAEKENVSFDNAEFTFHFLARKVGFEKITITFWDASFAREQEVPLFFYVT